MTRTRIFAAVLIGAVLATAAARAQEVLDREGVEQIVRDYLLEHPEVLVEAMDRLRAKERVAEQEKARKAVAANYDALAHSPNDPVAGNPDGDVVIVEFFDYACGYCKRVLDPLMQTVKTDGKIKLVFKEFPVLSPLSAVAARAALAARRQGKYEAYHVALMGTEAQLTEDLIYAVAADVGLNVERLKEDMTDAAVEDHIRESYKLAEALGINGTPAFIIGRELVPGAIGIEQMKQRVAEAREKQS